jgi:hypothetical protein
MVALAFKTWRIILVSGMIVLPRSVLAYPSFISPTLEIGSPVSTRSEAVRGAGRLLMVITNNFFQMARYFMVGAQLAVPSNRHGHSKLCPYKTKLLLATVI